MAVYKRDMVDINLETGNIHRSFLKHSIGYKDAAADHFGIRVFRNGEPVNLTGVSVQGIFMPPQGDPIAITTGNIVNYNEAEVVLPQACYNYDGQFTLAIKLVDATNAVTGTMRIVDGMVDNTHASGTVAPTSTVPTYQEVLSAYEQAIAVIGNSVRFDQSQSLTDTQKGTARTNIAAASESELSDVKSALLFDEGTIYTFKRKRTVNNTENGWKIVPSTGFSTSDSTYCLRKFSVTAGTIIKVSTDGDFQFQDTSNVPVSGTVRRIGKTYNAGTYVLEVPTGATWVILSVLKTSTAYDVYDNAYTWKESDADILSKVFNLASIPGESKVSETDFTDTTTGTTYVADTTNKTLTITNTGSSSYPCVQTPNTFVGNHLTAGKTYILHAKAEVTSLTSGTPDIRIAIRGMNGNADGIAKQAKLYTGEEGFISFVADSYMKRVSFFVGFGSSNDCVVKMSEIWLKEYDTTGIDDYAREEIVKSNALIKKLEDIPTENLIQITDFSVDGNTTHVTDTENNSVNVTSYTSNQYNNLSTPGTWIGSKIVPGKTYRLHAKAEKVSGSPYMVVAIRGVQGNVNAIAKRIEFGTQGGDDFVDFVADEYMKVIALFVSFGSSTINSVAKFSEIWIKEYGISGDDNSGSEFDAVQKVKNARHIRNSVGTPLTLLHFSDIHADTTAMGRIIRKAGEYGTLIDEMICTGDMCANDGGTISSWWNSNVLTCIGNHDSAKYTSGSGYDWTYYDMAQRDTWYIAPFESNWSITHTSGTSYYYKDYTTQKVRLIVMDAMLYTDNGEDATTQTAWLESLLADAITNELHVLIAIHCPHGGATKKQCSFSSYGEGTMPVLSDCDTPQAVIDAVATKITGGLKFIGYIVGHTHQDAVWDATGDGTQMMYCITCGIVSQKAQWEGSDQFRDSTLDAFNLVTIDTANTLVKIVRGGGADIDMRMRTRKAICFNYSTGEKTGEVL